MRIYRYLNDRGRVPAHTECPFARHCRVRRAGDCKHEGEHHPVEFSCAVARMLDILGRSRGAA